MTGIFKAAALGVIGALALLGGPAQATPLPAPEGEIILTISGDINTTNAGETATYDLDMLRAMPATRIETETIWTEGKQEFIGVSLHHLMQQLGVASGTLSAIALNDYAVSIPVSDAVSDGPIIAYMRNGREMSLRNKGPLWVIYPYDDNPEYQTEQFFSRSIWQLDRIVAQ